MDRRVQAVIDCDVQDPEATFVHCRLKSGQGGECFRSEDIVFECGPPGARHPRNLPIGLPGISNDRPL